MIFFSTHCVFQKLETGKTIGTRHERNGQYELELTSNQVVCISTSIVLDYHYRLGHPSLSTLKLLLI